MRGAAAAFLLVAALAGLAAGEEGYSFPAGWRPLRSAAVPSFVSALVKEAPRAGEVKSAEWGGASAFAVRLGDRPGAFREPLSALLGGLRFDESGRGILKASFEWEGKEGALALAYDGPSRTLFLAVIGPSAGRALESLLAARKPVSTGAKPWVYFVVLAAAVVLFAAYYRLRGFGKAREQER